MIAFRYVYQKNHQSKGGAKRHLQSSEIVIFDSQSLQNGDLMQDVVQNLHGLTGRPAKLGKREHQVGEFVRGLELMSRLPVEAGAQRLLRQSEFLLTEHASGAAHLSPEQLTAAADRLMETYQRGGMSGESLTTSQQLYEKAAEEYEAAGDFQAACSVRRRADEMIILAPTHPLHDVKTTLERGSSRDMGVHVSHQDTGVVRRGLMRASRKNVEGTESVCFDFGLTRPAREKIERTLIGLMANPELMAQEGIQVRKVPFLYRGAEQVEATEQKVYSRRPEMGAMIGEAYEVTFPGVGIVRVGASPEIRSLYPMVSVELPLSEEKGENLGQVKQMLTLLGLGTAVCPSRESDTTRMKIAHLFHQFFPQDAVKMEQTAPFYEMSVEELREEIVARQPKMAAIFSRYLDNPQLLREVEISPGRNMYYIADLGGRMREAGALGLMHGQRRLDGVVSTLKHGSLVCV